MGAFKIDDDFKKCSYELNEEEYIKLEKDILKNGVVSPVVLWNGIIIDGYNQYTICQAHKIQDIPIKEMDFKTKDEALEWVFRSQFKRMELNTFQRSKIALGYESVIIERIMKRQAIYYGDQCQKTDIAGSTQNRRTKRYLKLKRAEIAKIAGVSRTSIYRTRIVLEKGTQEQIKRAEKGDDGDSVGLIWNEIIYKQKDPDIKMRKCKVCGKDLPETEFYNSKPTTCKKCFNTMKAITGLNGKKLDILPELREIPDEEIIGTLYDTDREIEYTDDDLKEELIATIESFKWSVQNCLSLHKEILQDDRSKEKVLSNLSLLQKEIEKWKEIYNYG